LCRAKNRVVSVTFPEPQAARPATGVVDGVGVSANRRSSMRVWTLALPWLSAALAAAATGCDDGGAGGAADGDTDADTDGDADGDTDADTDADSECDSGNFSFFVMSLEKIQEWGGDEGLGGNLGGLAGADAKCQEAAEEVGACDKTWRAFLSVTDDGSGNPVDAIDRIGDGPWYDVNGLLLAEDADGLLDDRPDGATDPVWTDDWGTDWPFNQCLTTELGNCNHSYGDTHDTLTGSNRQGTLYGTDMKYTCNDWTSADVDVQLPIGHTWPRQLNGTDPNETNWLYSHTNCSGGGGPGGGGSGDCNGCGANINVGEGFEDGVGGDGGYGAWYCFAID
jgi:hypothetical protein